MESQKPSENDKFGPVAMSEATSSRLLTRLVANDPTAAREIHDRYLLRLLGLARRHLSSRLSSRVDPEDVVQSAYRSFYFRAAEGRFVLARAGDLWRLLAAIVVHKARSQIERHTAGKRSVQREADAGNDERHITSGLATPEAAAALIELLDRQFQMLPSAHRHMVEQRLAGQSIEIIADRAQRSQRTVRRVLEQFETSVERELREVSESE